MASCAKKIPLHFPFNKLSHEDLENLQESMDQCVEHYEYLIKLKNRDFMSQYCKWKRNELYNVQCAYEWHLDRLFQRSYDTCTFDILIDLANEKYYNQPQNPIECNQLDDQSDTGSHSKMGDPRKDEGYREGWMILRETMTPWRTFRLKA